MSGDIPKSEFVEWSRIGSKAPSLLPESQSQSTPDSVGGLFTQPQKSISKSQKPEKINTKKTTTQQTLYCATNCVLKKNPSVKNLQIKFL